MRRMLEAFLATLPALAVGCAGPRTAVANLAELYETGLPAEAVYAKQVTDRGFWERTGDTFHALFSDEPSDHDREKLDDPVEFAIDNLGTLESGETLELDPFERGRGIAVLADMGHRDPSRIVRCRSWETLVKVLGERPKSRFTFDATPFDATALEPQIDALLEFAHTRGEQAEAFVAQHGAAIGHGADVLAALRPELFPETSKLLLLVVKCGLIAERVHAPSELVDRLAAAAHALGSQVAFLAARPEIEPRRGLADLASEPAIAASKVLFAVDPTAATLELGTVFDLAPDSLVRIGWLQVIAQSGVRAAGVHPTLRGPMARDLDSPDASIAYWARQAIAAALALDPQKAAVDELRARWLALGDWDREARA